MDLYQTPDSLCHVQPLCDFKQGCFEPALGPGRSESVPFDTKTS